MTGSNFLKICMSSMSGTKCMIDLALKLNYRRVESGGK